MMDASPEARWLVEKSGVTRYVSVVVSSLFGGQEALQSYAFTCLFEPRKGGSVLCWWRRTLLVANHYIGYGGGHKKGSWRKL